MNTRLVIFLIALLLAAVAVGFVELHTTEETATMAMLLAAGAMLGFVRPRLFWLSGLVVGGSVPMAYAFAAAFRVVPREWPNPGGAGTIVGLGIFTIFVALVAAGLGALAGRARIQTF